MKGVHVRALKPEDDRSRFASGDEDLDRFFRRYAGQNQFRHHLGITYIATDDESIHGFLTVAASAIEIQDLPQKRQRGLPAYPLPVLRIARLASSAQTRGKGIGKVLLRTAFALAAGMAEKVGCVGVVVDAKEEAVSFYERYGFEAFEVREGESNVRPRPTLLFLPLGIIPLAGLSDGGLPSA